MPSPLLEPMRRRRGVSASISPLDRGKLFNAEPKTLSPLFDKAASTSPINVANSPGKEQCNSSPVLQLVPKCVAKLAALGKGGETLVKMVDPQPNWTLDDLRDELDALGGNTMTPTRLNTTTSPRLNNGHAKGWSVKVDVADVSDFKRESKPFRISAYDTDSESESESDESQGDDSEKENMDSYSSSEGSPESIDFRQPGREIQNVSSPSSFTFRSPGEAERVVLQRTGRVEAALYESDRARVVRVQEELRQRRSVLEVALLEESERAAVRLKDVVDEEEAKFDMLRRSDKHHQRTVAEKRDKYLLALQRDHEQRSQVEVQKMKREEEAARQKELAARQEIERRMKAKAEAEAKQQAEKLAAAEKERKQRSDAAEASARAASQRAEMERKQAEAKQSAAVAIKGPKPRVASSAAEAEARRMQILSQVDGAYQHLLSNPAVKKELRRSENQLAKYFVQVTPEADHVRKISGDILQLLRFEPPAREFVVSQIARKLLFQCDEQVRKLPSIAFALAQIVVNISNKVPVVMDVLLAQLHRACMLTVPKFYTYHKADFRDEREHYKLIGFEENNGNLEKTDEYIARMNTYITLFAAIVQTDGSNYGIANGWKWLSQVLNHLPANRFTVSALHAFLEIAGFAMYRAYGRAFLKLLMTIQQKFLPLFIEKDLDTGVFNRFETYIGTRLYESAPEGRFLR